MSNQDKDHSGAAVRGESVAEMQLVPKFAGQFNTHQEWVNKAQSWLKSPGYRPAMCVDVKCRRMSNGGDMGKARDEGTFPVRFFWECELAPVSAHAADAPSEPSEPLLTMAQVNAIRDTIKSGDGWDGDNWDFALANAVAANVKSRAADAINSQPNDPTGYVRISELKKLESNRVAGVGMMVQKEGGDGWTPIYASSQPTDGGVRNG